MYVCMYSAVFGGPIAFCVNWFLTGIQSSSHCLSILPISFDCSKFFPLHLPSTPRLHNSQERLPGESLQTSATPGRYAQGVIQIFQGCVRQCVTSFHHDTMIHHDTLRQICKDYLVVTCSDYLPIFLIEARNRLDLFKNH